MEKGSKPEAARSSGSYKNTPDDFYFRFLTGLLQFSENLEMKCGILDLRSECICVSVCVRVCMHM